MLRDFGFGLRKQEMLYLFARQRAPGVRDRTKEARWRSFNARNATPEAGMAFVLPVNSLRRVILLPFFVVARRSVVADRCKLLPNPEHLPD